MGVVAYTLCMLTALACAWLLLRGYAANRTRLLLWAGLCFVGLTVNNALVLLDLVVVPQVDLFALRNAAGLASMAILLFGLIWDAG
ncbi:MAG: hypothetical protein HY690_13630 [Chloroflexi bacterium]|nr:hypothetical protein [Chloroflexota bacterium]